MPPKTKITKEQIIDAAFEIVRREGVENVNARTVSKKLGCSTQPVMWHFKTIADMKKAIYVKADSFHTEYILDIHGNNPMKDIGLNYIRFAAMEKPLFRFLFQSNGFSGKSLSEMMEDVEVAPFYNLLAQQAQTDTRHAKGMFKTFFLYVHGYASILANNAMTYQEEEIASELEQLYQSIVHADEKSRHRNEGVSK